MPEESKLPPLLSRLGPAPGGQTKSRRRRGRGPGSGLGKTGGKGQKGQKARHPGNFSHLGFEGGQMPLQRRLPKIGFKNPFRQDYQVVNLAALESVPGSEINPESLSRRGLVRKAKSANPVKLLGEGEVSRALSVSVHAVSASARAKIERAGGSVRLIGTAKGD